MTSVQEDLGSEHAAGVAVPPAVKRRPYSRRLAAAVPWSLRSAEARGFAESDQGAYILRRETVYRRLLAGADAISAALAIMLAIEGFGDDRLRIATVLLLPLVVVVAKVQGLYDRDSVLLNKTTLDETPALFQAATLYTLLVKITEPVFVDGSLSGQQTLGLWAILLASAIVGRGLARRLARKALKPERVLVIGGPSEASQVAEKLAANPSVNAVVVGRIPLDPGPRLDRDALGDMSELETLVKELRVHRAIVAPGETTYDRTLDGIRAAKAVGVQVSVLPRLLEVVGSSVEFDQLYGLSILGVRRFGLTSSSQAIKRAMDQIGAFVGLTFLSPLFLVVALLVKRSSPGPVFFRQRRVGKDGAPFELVKFRTMYEGAESRRQELESANEAIDGLFKISDDPRVTLLGRYLRRTSLDELPQLLNVLRGEMSLVGPRPLIPEEDSRIEGRQRRLLHLKPGMTGQWQILGSSRIPLREMVTIDYLYVANWSLWGDIKIICRTIPYMLARRGL